MQSSFLKTDTVSIESNDRNRMAEIVEFLRNNNSREIASAILSPSASPAVITTLEQQCQFAHGALLILSQDSESAASELAKYSMTSVSQSPSVIVRNRLASRYGKNPSSLKVTISHFAFDDAPQMPQLELFILDDDGSTLVHHIATEERAQNYETHFAFRIASPGPDMAYTLCELLSEIPGQIVEGGGYNHYEDISVHYFRREAKIPGTNWPCRLELLAPGKSIYSKSVN